MDSHINGSKFLTEDSLWCEETNFSLRSELCIFEAEGSHCNLICGGLQCNFSTAEVLRKYIRYVLNERPFTPDTVADLLHLRKVSGLSEPEVAEVLNDVAKRIVKAKGTLLFHSPPICGGGSFLILWFCGMRFLLFTLVQHSSISTFTCRSITL